MNYWPRSRPNARHSVSIVSPRLARTEATPAELTALLLPFPSEQMKAHTVSDEVNHATIDHEHLVERCEPGPLAQPALF